MRSLREPHEDGDAVGGSGKGLRMASGGNHGLGRATTCAFRTRPVLVTPWTGIVQAAGNYHSCMRMSHGTAEDEMVR